MKDWLVLTYPLPNGLVDGLMQRVMVRNDFSHNLVHAFLDGLRCEVDHLSTLTAPMPAVTRQSGFCHWDRPNLPNPESSDRILHEGFV